VTFAPAVAARFGRFSIQHGMHQGFRWTPTIHRRGAKGKVSMARASRRDTSLPRGRGLVMLARMAPLLWRGSRLILGSVLALLLDAGESAPVVARPVELELVLGVDTSMSVAGDEFALQMAGYAQAFRHPDVVRAIEGTAGGIAVTLVQWADAYQQAVSIEWTLLDDSRSAAGFADLVAATGRRFTGPGTALATALAFCLRRFDGNGFEGRRRVVDLSGDGRDNRGPRVTGARSYATFAGITINGLAILNDEPFLDRYFERQVIAGADAFVIAASDYHDFAEAIVKKLIREIGGPQLARRAVAPDYWARAVLPTIRRTTSSSTMRWNSMSMPLSVRTRS